MIHIETESGVEYDLDTHNHKIRRSHAGTVSAHWAKYEALTMPVVGTRMTVWFKPWPRPLRLARTWTTSTITNVEEL